MEELAAAATTAMSKGARTEAARIRKNALRKLREQEDRTKPRLPLGILGVDVRDLAELPFQIWE